MKNTMKMQWALPGLAVASCAFLSLALPGSASAQSAAKPLFANVSADAQCTVTSTAAMKDVMVDAGLIQKDTPSSGPFVSTVVFSLEQHFPNKNYWSSVDNSEVKQDVNTAFALLPAGGRYDVALQDYSGVCSLVSQAANAVRAVVQITVDNANTKRPGANVFTGRCISFPNPCRP